MRFQPLAPIFKVEMPVLAWRSWHAKDENLVLKSTLNMGERGTCRNRSSSSTSWLPSSPRSSSLTCQYPKWPSSSSSTTSLPYHAPETNRQGVAYFIPPTVGLAPVFSGLLPSVWKVHVRLGMSVQLYSIAQRFSTAYSPSLLSCSHTKLCIQAHPLYTQI